MAKLLIFSPEGRRFEYKLDKEEMNIGRVPGNDLVLPYSSVSRKHARLRKRVFGYYLEDHNSTNGTIVNGEYVKEKRLSDRDEIFMGELMLVFFYDDAEYEETTKESSTPEAYKRAITEPPPPPSFKPITDPKSTLEIDINEIKSRYRKDGTPGKKKPSD